MTSVAICTNCGNERPAGVRFCSKCGGGMVEAEPGPGAIDPAACAVCGRPFAPSAKFCGSCGNEVPGAGGADATFDVEPGESEGTGLELPLGDVVDALEAVLGPGSSVVLIGGQAKKRQMRLEVIADESGKLSQEDRLRLGDLLAELMAWEGYLRGDLVTPGGRTAYVWHVIGGTAFSLRADHAEAVIEYRDLLGPSSILYGTVETADAPPIDVDEA